MGNGPAHVAKTGRFLSNWQRSISEILALTSDFRRSIANGALPMLLLQLPRLLFQRVDERNRFEFSKLALCPNTMIFLRCFFCPTSNQ